jgi:7-cyano-7-deazaguanine synthase in queuosine biosynthesis
MFSSGLDSYLIKKIGNFKNEECLFIRMGTKENRIEEEFIDENFPGVLKAELPINEFKLDNEIIPYRNHMLALIGAQYSNNIIFGFTAGDTTKDKDYVFKAQMEGILNYFSLDEHKVRVKGPFTINMPYKDMTKAQMVNKYLDRFALSIEKLFSETSSCYAGEDEPCGQCRSCLRKYVALMVNGINCSWRFKNNPALSMPDFLRECIQKDRKFEISDVYQCLQLIEEMKNV